MCDNRQNGYYTLQTSPQGMNDMKLNYLLSGGIFLLIYQNISELFGSVDTDRMLLTYVFIVRMNIE